MIRLMGMFLNTKEATGEKYFKGRLGTADVLLFKNTRKRDDKDFDYIMYIDEQKKKEIIVDNFDEDEDVPV